MANVSVHYFFYPREHVLRQCLLSATFPSLWVEVSFFALISGHLWITATVNYMLK